MKPRRSRFVPGFLLLALAGGAAAVAQTPPAEQSEIDALRKEIRTLQSGQAAIRRQLAEIKNLIEKGGGKPQQARPNVVPDVTIDLAGAPFQGKENAPITIVEFSDFQ